MMIRTLSLATLIAAAACVDAPAQTAAKAAAQATPADTETADLIITITDIETISGTIRLGLYEGKIGYEGDEGIAGADIAVDGDQAAVTFEGLAPGTYGVKLYHDVNDSGEMDTNPFGIPTEPYAFSNNARGRFGPAGWDDAGFEVMPGANTHTIALN